MSVRARFWFFTVLSLWVIAGCGAEVAPQLKSTAGLSPNGTLPMSPADKAPAKAPQESGSETTPALPRKIIYNAQIDLVVESLTAAESQIMQLLKSNGGYVSETEMTTYPAAPRSATWKVRVPVDTFDAFIASVVRLGELNRNHVDSQDVTQEYYDLEARIANKQQEEKRLLKHLADSTGKLEEILAVERELSRVRGEIEQGQGRLRLLANQTALSTVTITATEARGYTAPVTPTFGTLIGRTFGESSRLLIGFGKTILLAVVALVPWLPVIAIVVLPIVWLARRRHASAVRPV